MTPDPEDTLHNLPAGPTVFVWLNRAPVETDFRRAIGVLADECGASETDVTFEDYWQSMSARLTGKARWDQFRARYRGPTKTEDGWQAFVASRRTIPNLQSVQAMMIFQEDGIRYLLDVFNPQNELGLPAACGGDHVLALMLGEASFPAVEMNLPIRDRLTEVASFWRVLERLTTVLPTRGVRGGTYIARVVLGYAKGVVPDSRRPWDFTWPMNVVDGAAIGGDVIAALRPVCARLGEFPAGRLLVQVTKGLHTRMDREIEAAAMLLGAPSVTEIKV